MPKGTALATATKLIVSSFAYYPVKSKVMYSSSMSHQRVDADSRRAQQVVPDSIIHRFHFKTVHGAFEQRLQKSTRLYTDLP